MRWIALALLAANLGLLAQYLLKATVQPAPAEQVSAVDETTRLVLLRELPPGKSLAPRAPLVSGELPAGVVTAAESMADSTPAAPKAQATRCYGIGVFTDQKVAARVKGLVEKAGGETTPMSVEHLESIRYWVVLPPSPSREKALAVVERLKRAGVKDYYLIPSGENRNALSLGLFSSNEAARRRLADVAALKLKIRVEEVKYSTEQFSFDTHWPRQSVPTWEQLLPKGIEATPKECHVSN